MGNIEDESWRYHTMESRSQLAVHLKEAMLGKWTLGAEQFGDTFRGEPEDHILEEWIDMGFYLHFQNQKLQYYMNRAESAEFVGAQQQVEIDELKSKIWHLEHNT